MIEGTAEKYKNFQEQIEDRDTVIFVTIPALLILKNLDDDDKGICKLFFPPMFGEESKDHQSEETKDSSTSSSYQKYRELRAEYERLRAGARNVYDFYNLVEKSVLEMEGEDSSRLSQELLTHNQVKREDLQKMV
jgi:hypothetical protein